MIRRGTVYGPPLPDSVLEDDGADRGLMFAFVGAHIGRQFVYGPFAGSANPRKLKVSHDSNYSRTLDHPACVAATGVRLSHGRRSTSTSERRISARDECDQFRRAWIRASTRKANEDRLGRLRLLGTVARDKRGVRFESRAGHTQQKPFLQRRDDAVNETFSIDQASSGDGERRFKACELYGRSSDTPDKQI
jgi:hypothetical protein